MVRSFPGADSAKVLVDHALAPPDRAMVGVLLVE
jgi:hypothetical protein